MIIEESNLFAGLSSEFMDELNKSLIPENPKDGEMLYRKGEHADYLYILVEGRVRVALGDQGQIALVVSNPGDAVGWSSLVEDEVHSAAAECLGSCRINKIARETLAGIFDRHPVTGLQFYRRLAKLFRRQLVDTYRLIPSSHGEMRSSPGF